MSVTVQPNTIMNEPSPSDAALVELLSLTVTVNRLGATFYRNHLGQAHRTLGPAVIYPNGAVCWYHLGQRHRTDGPAEIWADGTKKWYQNGLLHRIHGPAIIYSNGSVCWYHLGQRHRTDGPAVEGVNGRNHWFIHGHELTEEEFNERIKSV